MRSQEARRLFVAVLTGACVGERGMPIPPASRPEPALQGAPVVRAQRHLPVWFGGTVLALTDGRRAVVSDPDRDQVEVVDLDSGAERLVPLRVDDEPGQAVEDANHLVHVVLRRAGEVATIDPVEARVLARHPVCAAPHGITWDARGALLHVACAGGELVSLTADGAVARSRVIAPDLRDVVVLAQGVLVSRLREADAFLMRFDGTLTPIARPAAQGIGTSSLRDTMVAWRMVSNGTRTFLAHQDAPRTPLRVSPPDVPPPTTGSYGSSGAFAVERPSQTVLSELVGLDTDRPRWVERRMSPLLGPAIDVALSPSDGRVALVAPGDGLAMRRTQQVSVSALPEVDDPRTDSTQFPFLASLPGHAVAVAFDRGNRILIEMRSPHQLVVFSSDRSQRAFALGRRDDDVGRDPFLGDDVRDTGRDLFFVTSQSGLACVTCHPDGGDDGRVWTFERIGPRRTPSLRGGIAATAPFHWDGDLSTFGALMHEVFTRRMGGGIVRDDQVDALAAWVEGIPAVRVAPPADTAQAARGEALFRSVEVGCVGCHAGPKYTNNATVDVGTRGAFQVPSLSGLAARAPYMHDGCAATLRQRFSDVDCGGGDRHGRTSQLTDAEVDDLVAWLSTR